MIRKGDLLSAANLNAAFLSKTDTASQTVAGPVTFGGSLTIDGGAGVLALKPGSKDHVYIQFFADSQAPTTRSGWIGYGSTGTSTLTIRNEMASGNLELITPGSLYLRSNSVYINTSNQIVSTVATGTAPLVVSSTTTVTNLSADLLDGQHGSYYQNASNLNAGNLNIARMPTGGNWSLSSNLTIDTSTLAIDITNDRVGIGTASPADRLHVAGRALVDSTLFVRGGSGWATTTPTITLAVGDNDTGLHWVSDGNLAVYTNNTERIRISSSGNVGIGTTSPSDKLHVIGHIRVGTGANNIPIRYVASDAQGYTYRIVLPVGADKYA